MSIEFETIAKAFETEASNATGTARIHTQTVLSILSVLEQEGYTLAKSLPIASSYADFIVDTAKEAHIKAQRQHKQLAGTETLNEMTASYAQHVIDQLPGDIARIKRNRAEAKSGITRSNDSDRKTVKHETITPAGGSFNGGSND